MKKIFGTVCLGFLSFCMGAQNLVPNGSFETFTSCPSRLTQINLAPSWYSPTLDSSDFFHSCAPAGLAGVPQNALGFQTAHSGSGYAGVSCFENPGNKRSYIQARLSDSLVAQRSYCISFYVSLANTSGFAITQFGAFLSPGAIAALNQAPLPFVPQISSAAHIYLKDTLSWVLITGNYIAQGGEKFITLGNFKDDANTDTLRLNGLLSTASYYYIDDVSVKACDSLTTASSLIIPNVFTPNSDLVNDVFKITTTNISYLNCKIYDRWGGKVYEMVADYDSWDGRNSTGQACKDGVYYYVLKANGSDGKSYAKTGFVQLIR